ncbi:MAG: hypothetical protein P8J61_01095 [Gammaproteobacteria bacterium]|nr:hypothetical protein [Gammaproteobacteria bacterium]
MLPISRKKLNLLAAFACSALIAAPMQVFAQDQEERPDLLFKENWQQSEAALGTPMSSHASDNDYYLVGQNAVQNNDLELGLYGYRSGDITVYEHEGRIDLWTGLAGSPVAVTLKSSRGFIDLRGLARMRAIVRTNNLHSLHPVIRLADGTLAVGSQSIQTGGAFLSIEVAFENQDWFVLDQEEVSVGGSVVDPDLSRIDEVGLANLVPGGGHGFAGWSNISTVEVFANTIAR